jgi:RNA polymerase sigma-54 factor
LDNINQALAGPVEQEPEERASRGDDEGADDFSADSHFDATGLLQSDPYERSDSADEQFDPISMASAATHLQDHVLSALRSMGDGTEWDKTCVYVVYHLDERGWLRNETSEIARELGVSIENVEAVIEKLQMCDPSGIGARDLQECLLIQLRHYEEDGCGNAVATRLVRDFWEGFIQRRTDTLARKLGCTITELHRAIKFIQTQCSPNPADGFRDPWDYRPDTKSEAIRPDVTIRRTETGFEVEVHGPDTRNLHVNSRYSRMYDAIKLNGPIAANGPKAGGRATGTRLTQQEKKHILQYVERAQLFLRNIAQRRRTIEKITRQLIGAQQGFIETGSRAFLIPMTRTELAKLAELHESTVSRALLRKFVQLPNQDVLPFDAFFAPASSVKDAIQQIIESEDPANPYSDEAIRKMLAAMDVVVARRTIVKYREAMRIPASYLRRRH